MAAPAPGPMEDTSLVQALVEAAPDALLLVDDEGRLVFVNGQAESLFCRARGELLGQPIEVLLPERFRGRRVHHRGAFTARPRTRPMGSGLSLFALRGDGTEVPVEVSLSEVRTSRARFVAAAVRDVTETRRVEETLREAEARFRLALDEAPIGMALVGLDGRFMRVNHALSEIVGYSASELTGLTFQEITHPHDLESDLELVEQLARSGHAPRYQRIKRYLRKDGSVVHVNVSGSAVLGPDGAPLYYITQMEDISDRLKAEEALRHSEEALRRAQRVAHLGSFEVDLRTDKVTCSAELYALFGIESPPEDPRALVWSQFIHPQDRELYQRIEEAIRERRPYQLEVRIVRPDGAERILLHQAEVISEGGVPLRIVGTALDITGRKRAEREREETVRRLQAVLDQTPLALLLVHRDEVDRVHLNRQAKLLLGLREDSVGDLPHRLFTPDGRPVPHSDYPSQRALRGEPLGRAEYLIEDAGGRRIPVLAGASPIVGVEGTIRDAVVAFQDLRVEKELEQLRAEWNSVIAHDLRQPLNAIGLSARLLMREVDDGPRTQAERIQRLTTRLNRMIEDLLDLSRLDAHQLALSRSRTDLARLVRDSADQLRLTAPDRPVEVRVHGEPGELWLDPDRISQVMENLLSNAVKYGRRGTPIEVALGAGNGRAWIAVSNQGAGIAPEEQPRLFERFHRTPQARKSGIQGTGLGLYITRALVEAHGGQIWVRSTPGERTTFVFELPLGLSRGAGEAEAAPV